jgi:hypothetical protein
MAKVVLLNRLIGPVLVDVIIQEQHKSSLGLPKQPVEIGAEVTDHVYIEPKVYTVEFADGDAAATYMELVRYQEKRERFQIISGLTVYKNMMLKEISVTRDREKSRIVHGTATLEEVITVQTGVAPLTGPSISPNAMTENAKDQDTKDGTSTTTGSGDDNAKVPNRTMLFQFLDKWFPTWRKAAIEEGMYP